MTSAVFCGITDCFTHGTNERNAKFGQRGRKGSRDLLLKFWDSLHISGSVGARNVKFDVHIHHQGTNERNEKLGQRVDKRSRDLLLKFWHPSISLEWLELETSNSARQSKMPITVTINRSNRNRKYNSNMVEIRFLNQK